MILTEGSLSREYLEKGLLSMETFLNVMSLHSKPYKGCSQKTFEMPFLKRDRERERPLNFISYLCKTLTDFYR